MKINFQQLGYAIGVLICFPILLYIANKLFFSGNSGAEEYINQYRKECIAISVEIDKKYESGHSTYFSSLRKRGKGIKSVYWVVFYSNEHQKYFSLTMFVKDFIREDVINWLDPAIVKVLVNSKQLNSPFYGSKEHPVPVFCLDVMNAGENDDEVRESFHASDREIQYSIEQYLKFIIPKKEFKQLIEEE